MNLNNYRLHDVQNMYINYINCQQMLFRSLNFDKKLVQVFIYNQNYF